MEHMSALEITLRLIAGVGLMLANAFFVSVEFALTRLRQFPEETMKEHAGLDRAWEMTKKLEIYLTGCQLGISVSSIVLGVVAEPAITYVLRPIFELIGLPDSQVSAVSVVVAVVIMNLVHKIWGEQAPTYLGVERPLDVARFLSPPLYWWTKLTYPFIYLGDGLAKRTLKLFGVEVTRSWTEAEEGDVEIESRADMKRKVAEILGHGELSEERRREVMNAVEIGERHVADIMIARENTVIIDATSSTDDLLAILTGHEFVRYPVVDDGEPVGILYSPGVFKHIDALKAGETTVSELAAEAVTVEEDLPISKFVDHLQDAQQEAAFVCRDGEWVGFATATDAFEAVLGDLEDPFD
jgi:CBS domain containing-hemolysin-like protein